MTLTGSDDKVTGAVWHPLSEPTDPDPTLARLNPAGKPIRFGGVRTAGACRIVRDGRVLSVRPLPDSPEFTVRIDWAKLPWALPAPGSVHAIGFDGKPLYREAVQRDGEVVLLTCAPDVFEYRLE